MTVKRKLELSEITKCHPTLKNKKAGDRCLPSTVYDEISKKTGKPVTDQIFLGCGVGEEHCLLDKTGWDEKQKNKYRTQYLRPRRPIAWDAKPNTWLDNFNIADCMKQYETVFPWFTFLGVFPIDFSAPDPYQKDGVKQCLYKETCELNLIEEYEKKNKRGIGMIFNLDPHDKGGSHWVALYINIENRSNPMVGYFDSYGYKVPPMIARLMRSFKLQIKHCSLGYNARRFQFGGSECGMFSMYFIICMLHGISFKQFCKDAVNDEYMLQLRTILFSK
jgi:hypothetical protein